VLTSVRIWSLSTGLNFLETCAMALSCTYRCSLLVAAWFSCLIVAVRCMAQQVLR
jgi:hypothetical protein